MTPEQSEAESAETRLAQASTGELVGRLAEEGKELVKKEIELAKAELRAELKDAARMVMSFAAAGVVAFITIELLFAALTLGLGEVMPAWAAALAAAGLGAVAIVIALIVGWQMRVRDPLHKTRKTLKEDAQWVQQRLS